ncbi:MAG TPA: MFS transporter [Gemmatimonadaceae bacterium]|jgi:sugar (glycoside-pentoside-hexuronide) transporter|nr:MFS transporter [Gemmatimonadaceae bacterium]
MARISVTEKIGYGLGDAAANFIFQTMLVFQLAFYTDTFGITAAAAGTLFLIVRVWDAIFDPVMGVIADRTNTKWGKFRPWILWTAVPFGIMGFLTFTTPPFGPQGKLVYAYVTYIILMMVYSANNLPYSALSGVITGNLAERTSLSSYRFVCAMSAAFVIQGLALPMVNYFGQGDTAKGYQYTMGIFSALAVVFFFITFATTRERVQPDPMQQSSVKQDFADLAKNGPWIVMFVLTLVLFITLSMRGGVMLYYFKYFVGREDLFSFFNVCGLGATIVGIILSTPVAKRYGKRDVFIAGLALTVVFTAAFVLLPPDALVAIFAMEVLRQFAYGFTIPLLWAMMADVADYSEWKNRRRATAIVFSAIVFALKAGLGFGGAIGGWLLSAYGYVPNVDQTANALQGIKLTASVFPAVTFAICVICLFFYRIDKKLEIEITDELAERRRQYASSSATPVPVPAQ